MAKEISQDVKIAANTAFKFLVAVAPQDRFPIWTLAVGKRIIQVRSGSQQAIDALAKNIRHPSGCCMVTKGVQHTIHVAAETHIDHIKKASLLPKPIARVQSGKMIAFLWRLANPIDISRAAELASMATKVIGGHDLGVLFPLPGSVRYGQPVRLAGDIEISAKTITRPTLFMTESGKPQEPAISTNVSDPALTKRAGDLTKALESFGVKASVVSAFQGPILTRFELVPGDGVKVSRIVELTGDIALKLKVESVRVTPSTGGDTVGVEIRNDSPKIVQLEAMLSSEAFQNSGAALPVALGVTTAGEPVVADLATMPHVLIAGATGSGKSVGVRTLILSLTCALPPEKLGLILIDPKKGVELSVFDGIPYLVRPVISDRQDAVEALRQAVHEMERRYDLMKAAGVRTIEAYNKRMPVVLPYIVIIVDELAFLMAHDKKSVESAIDQLAAVARASGLHLVIATQRPGVDVVTGTIKANLTARLCYATASIHDSRTMEIPGAETLFGRGDMLYRETGGKITRLHGPFVDDDTVEAIAAKMRKQRRGSYQSGTMTALPETRPSRLLPLSASAPAVRIDTPKDRVRDALSGGVTLSMSSLTERASVTRQQVYRMVDSGFIESVKLPDGRTGLKLLSHDA